MGNNFRQPNFFLLLALLAGCLSACQTAHLFGPDNPHDQYAASLRKAGLDQTALGRQWLTAAQQSLNAPLTITLPYQEQGFFPPDRALAFGYRFTLPRGQRLEVNCEIRSQDSTRIFLDLWRDHQDLKDRKLLAVVNDSGRLFYEAAQETSFLLRLQPELLAPASYELTITAGPSLGFPVKGGNNKDIGSQWHDPRDAGARKHEGIDIFAKRGTPAVAAADGIVTAVRTSGLGGRTVFMQPSGKNFSLYYAHLDTQIATTGQRVRTGDTLGLVGNTGNARTTPPHLHFGIYTSNGAINPLPFVQQESTRIPPLKGKENLKEQLMRTKGKLVLKGTAGKQGKQQTLPSGTLVTILAVSSEGYRVCTPDQREDLLLPAALTSLNQPLRKLPRPTRAKLLYAPTSDSPLLSDSLSGIWVVLAYFQDYAFVQLDDHRGWLFVKDTP